MAERLKVRFIPHEKRIASMRFDVVNVCRQSDDSILFTLNTEWMSLEDPCAKTLPLVAITSNSRTTCALGSVRFSLSFHLSVTSIALFKVQVTVFLTESYRLATAGILAYR